MDIDAFLSADKSIVIAPAGYGKTYTIAEALASYNGTKKVLVLTHTHAGIASLKEKFEKKKILPSTYHLDTICSFALNLTSTYHIKKEEIPSENDVGKMFNYAIEHATKILKAKPICHFLKANYDHLIVDEYQDCSITQHQMIMEMANSIKTHLLGDPLQGIFGFRNEQIVDFDNDTFARFRDNSQTLDKPWRWINAGNPALGYDLASIRSKLEAKEDVDLRNYRSIEVTIGDKNDYAKPKNDYRRRLYTELKNDVVFIHPNSTSVEPRKNVVMKYPQLQLLESIDDKDYYKWCHQFDSLSGQPLIKSIGNMMRTVCSKQSITYWIRKDGGLVRKKNQYDMDDYCHLSTLVSSLHKKKSYGTIARFVKYLYDLPIVTVYRKSFVMDIYHVLLDADRLGLSSTEALVRNRNIMRRKGRKVHQKSIGTTLLTKGLEFDNVVVLNAQEFKDPRHLYVALTRCCKRLVVITDNYVLHPYNDDK